LFHIKRFLKPSLLYLKDVPIPEGRELRDSPLLGPILKVEDKLLAPLVFTKYILYEIEEIQYILSRFNNLNLVKAWLINYIEEDKVTINGKIRENSKDKYMIKCF
jgi:hypothetical protein